MGGLPDHINRHAEHQDVEASFGNFLADNDWREKYEKLPNELSNERKMLHLLKEKMRERQVATYLPDFSIMVPRIDRLKMRLILGTHSSKGLEVFRGVQEKVEREELEMRLNLREGERSQISLFSSADTAAFEQQLKGVGCKANQKLAEALIVNFLKFHTSGFPEQMYFNAMEHVPIRKPHLNQLLIEMRHRGVVRFELPPRKSVPQKDTSISLVT